MNFYISDLHFGHKAAILAFDRPYADVKEMNEDIIRRWQERVGPEDTVYILGDLLGYGRNPVPYLKRLPGQKVLILGNHDDRWIRHSGIVLEDWFEGVYEQLDIEDEGVTLRLCHDPWGVEIPENGFLVYGHIHNNTQNPMWEGIWKEQRAFNATVDVALDVGGPFPATLRELQVTNAQFRVFNPVCRGEELWYDITLEEEDPTEGDEEQCCFF